MAPLSSGFRPHASANSSPIFPFHLPSITLRLSGSHYLMSFCAAATRLFQPSLRALDLFIPGVSRHSFDTLPLFLLAIAPQLSFLHFSTGVNTLIILLLRNCTALQEFRTSTAYQLHILPQSLKTWKIQSEDRKFTSVVATLQAREVAGAELERVVVLCTRVGAGAWDLSQCAEKLDDVWSSRGIELVFRSA